MKDIDFVKYVEAHYGKYASKLSRILVAEHLTQYNEKQLDLLFNALIEHFSTKWNKAPDVPVLKETAEKAKIGTHVVGDDVYQDGKLIGHFESNNVFIPNLSKKSGKGGLLDYSARIREEMTKLVRAKGARKQVDEVECGEGANR